MTLAARTARRLVVGACILAGLASCGSEKEETKEREEDRVADVIRTAATSTDPGHCTRLLTPRFVQQSQLEKGAAAIRSCRREARDAAGNPRSVSITKIDVAESAATARVAFRGGDTDGQTLNLILVKQGNQWKVDYVESFARFDREKFLKATRRSLVRPPDAVPPDAASCITRRLDRLSDREIQRLVIDANPVQLFTLFRSCFPAQQGGGTGGEAAATPGREAPVTRRPVA